MSTFHLARVSAIGAEPNTLQDFLSNEHARLEIELAFLLQRTKGHQLDRWDQIDDICQTRDCVDDRHSSNSFQLLAATVGLDTMQSAQISTFIQRNIFE